MTAAVPVLVRLARWAAGLRLAAIPEAVRDSAKNQVLSTLAAVHAGWASDLGPVLARAFPPPGPGLARLVPTGAPCPPEHAAFFTACLSMVLDYDDVMLGGHTGHSAVLVPLAFAVAGGRAGADLLVAQVAANEVAARLNAVTALGPTRGQMATHLHAVAAAAALARLSRLTPETFATALALAASYPSQALFPAFLGSDAKALCAAWPLRQGIDAVAAAVAGLAGRRRLAEEPRGLWDSLSPRPVPELAGGLGRRWHTGTNCVKAFAACGYLTAVLEAAVGLVRDHRLDPAEVAEVEVAGSLFTLGMDAHSAPYLDGPRSPLVTLTFSTPYAVAAAIVAGDLGPEQLGRRWRDDPLVWELAGRVRVRHDAALSAAAIAGDLPVGAALARVGRREAAGFAWSLAAKAFGRGGRWRHPAATARLLAAAVRKAAAGPDRDLTRATKPLGARVRIATRDGRRLERSVAVPAGFVGAPGEGPAERRRLAREKFLRAAAHTGTGRSAVAAGLIERLETLSAASLARAVDLNCLAIPAFGGRRRARP
jgi:2-methylcitrate dehydratase PrpD